MTTKGIALLLVIGPMIGLAVSTPALAQFTQYTPPGGVDQLEASDIKKELETAIQDSKWRLGKLFLDPWITLKDLGYDDNVGNRPEDAEQLTDYTATLGLGLRGYVPVGARGTLALHALPEYVWWDELAERRRVNGRYGVGFFAGGARFDIGISATGSDSARFFSREFEDRVYVTDERGSLSFDFALGRGFAVFSNATFVRLGFEGQDENAPDLSTADRDEQVVRLGLRRKLPWGLSIGAGLETSDVEFTETDSPMTNTGQAPFVQVTLDRDTLSGTVLIAERDLEFRDDRLRYVEPSGRIFVAWRPFETVEFQAFGSRSLVYSLNEAFAFFEDSSVGIGVIGRFGKRFEARFFTEEGSNDYTTFDPQTVGRLDDFRAVGGKLEIKLGKITTVIEGSSTKYDSTIPSLGRTIKAVALGVTVGSTTGSPWS